MQPDTPTWFDHFLAEHILFLDQQIRTIEEIAEAAGDEREAAYGQGAADAYRGQRKVFADALSLSAPDLTAADLHDNYDETEVGP